MRPPGSLMMGLVLAAVGLRAAVFPLPREAGARERREAAVAALLALSEADLVALVPAQSGIYFTDCPHCQGGSQDLGDWSWSVADPGRLTCRNCGEVYPGNPRYPESGEVRVEAPSGEHRYPYHERPDGYRLYFRAHADYLTRAFLADRCQDLGDLYRLTGEEVYARRCGLLLDRFAQVYPGYACKYDYPFRQKRFSPHHTPRIEGVTGFRVSKWSWWAYMDIARELVQAYEAVRDWDGLASLNDGGARRRIEADLLGGMVAYVLAIPDDFTNMSPVTWADLIYAGRVLERPEWITASLERADRFMREQFLYDGHWRETAPSYCQQVVGLMATWNQSLAGYRPGGAAGAAQEEILARVQAGLARLREAYTATLLPDGRPVPVNDTWGRPGKAPRQVRSGLLPGVGLALLAAGDGENQVVAWLNNTAGTGHKQSDALSFGLFAHGVELCRDLGYTHTAWRAWSLVMMSHNTVVVDGLDSRPDPWHRDNRLRAFAVSHPRLQVVEAENEAAYGERCTRFRRTLVLVGAGAADAYLVDLFQVDGGSQHDWLLHGPADEASTMVLSGCDLAPFDGTLMNPGTEFALPRGESFGVGPAGGYGFVRSLRQGVPGGPLRLDLRLASQPETGVTTWLPELPDTTVYLGEAPRLRPAERHDQRLPEFYAPAFCARHRGAAGLRSRFVAVHVPRRGSAVVAAVAAETAADRSLITVTLADGGRDDILIGHDGPAHWRVPTPLGELVATAHWAVVRSRPGQAGDLLLVDGGSLSLAGETLATEPGAAGLLADWGELGGADAGGWLDLPGVVPAPPVGIPILLELADRTVLPFTPVRWEPRAGATRVLVRERPALVREGGRLRVTAAPQREIEGAEIRWRVPAVAQRLAP